jgi:hypothetical protein
VSSQAERLPASNNSPVPGNESVTEKHNGYGKCKLHYLEVSLLTPLRQLRRDFFYATRVVSNQSRRSVLPRTSWISISSLLRQKNELMDNSYRGGQRLVSVLLCVVCHCHPEESTGVLEEADATSGTFCRSTVGEGLREACREKSFPNKRLFRMN